MAADGTRHEGRSHSYKEGKEPFIKTEMYLLIYVLTCLHGRCLLNTLYFTNAEWEPKEAIIAQFGKCKVLKSRRLKCKTWFHHLPIIILAHVKVFPFKLSPLLSKDDNNAFLAGLLYCR